MPYCFIPAIFTTDKTIKLWKIGHQRKTTDFSSAASYEENGTLKFPPRSSPQRQQQRHRVENTHAQHNEEGAISTNAIGATPLHASVKRVYSNAHAYHINSLAVNSDGQTYVSADDLRINWWDLGVSDTCFSK